MVIKGRENEWMLGPYLNLPDLWLSREGEPQVRSLPYSAKDLGAAAVQRRTAHGRDDGNCRLLVVSFLVSVWLRLHHEGAHIEHMLQMNSHYAQNAIFC